MAYSDFVALYALDSKRTPEELLAEQPLCFPLATNQRGEALVDSLKHWIELDLSGKRILDIGCAYGGLSIALAQAGAKVVGIETNQKLLGYAEANAYGSSDIKFSLVDIASLSIREKFAAQSFDIIFLSDVLDRHYEIDTLVSNIDHLLAPGGLVYFKTVNGNSMRFALADAQKKTFGISLVEPDRWFYWQRTMAAIYYRPVSSYLAMFQYYNMPKRALFDDERSFARFSEKRLTRRLKEIFTKARTDILPDENLKPLLRRQTTKLRDRFTFDYKTHGEDYVRFKYGSSFFVGVVGRADAVIEWKSPTIELPEYGMVGRTDEPATLDRNEDAPSQHDDSTINS